MANQQALTREQIIAILQANAKLHANGPAFVDYFVDLALYLIDQAYVVSGERPRDLSAPSSTAAPADAPSRPSSEVPIADPSDRPTNKLSIKEIRAAAAHIKPPVMKEEEELDPTTSQLKDLRARFEAAMRERAASGSISESSLDLEDDDEIDEPASSVQESSLDDWEPIPSPAALKPAPAPAPKPAPAAPPRRASDEPLKFTLETNAPGFENLTPVSDMPSPKAASTPPSPPTPEPLPGIAPPGSAPAAPPPAPEPAVRQIPSVGYYIPGENESGSPVESSPSRESRPAAERLEGPDSARAEVSVSTSSRPAGGGPKGDTRGRPAPGRGQQPGGPGGRPAPRNRQWLCTVCGTDTKGSRICPSCGNIL